MSIIGPRPGLWNQDVLTAERDKYGANDVKPGLTGWAQINGRDELEIPEKAKLDGYYVQNMGFKMDAKVFLRSVHVFGKDESVVEGGTGEMKKQSEEKKIKKKILVICQYYKPEPFRISDICEEMVRRGHEVHVVTGYPNYPEGIIYEGYGKGKYIDEVVNGVKIHRCYTIPRETGIIKRMLNYYSYAVSSTRYVLSNKCIASDELLSELQPDGYLVLGDTNSCLSAISAKRLHIPLFHMEAGNRCKDECLPEETNRRIVDVISDVNLCYSEFARKYLADTGLPKERTYMTGSPMAEVLRMNLEKIQKSDVLERLGLEKDKYILLSAHREENIDSEKNFLSLFTAINALAEKYDMPILYSCHPRSKNRLEKSGFRLDPRVRVNEPLGFNDYNKLQMNALAIVSDSGTLPEESSFYLSIGHPIAAVCIRTSTERPEALEAGDFILAGITTKELLNATDMAIAMKKNGVLGKPCPDYVDETVSMKVVRIIQGYVNVVNKMVWRKDQ